MWLIWITKDLLRTMTWRRAGGLSNSEGRGNLAALNAPIKLLPRIVTDIAGTCTGRTSTCRNTWPSRGNRLKITHKCVPACTPVKYTCFWHRSDNLVIPSSSVPRFTSPSFHCASQLEQLKQRKVSRNSVDTYKKSFDRYMYARLGEHRTPLRLTKQVCDTPMRMCRVPTVLRSIIDLLL